MKTTSRTRAGRVPIAGFVAAAAAVGAMAALPATTAGAATRAVTVSSQTIGKHGKILVAKGKALYILTNGTPCGSACLKVWPALTVSASSNGATAGSGVQQSMLGVTTTSSGAHQVTYNGQPLFWFFKDSKGTLKGNVKDKWGTWTAVVLSKPAHATSGTPTTSNSGANAGGGGVNF
jgi:predicted lipoprotein with Yx(FWY)xxD motif